MGIEPTWERLHAPTPDLKSGSPTSELGASKVWNIYRCSELGNLPFRPDSPHKSRVELQHRFGGAGCPTTTQHSVCGCRHTWPGGLAYPLGSNEKFQRYSHLLPISQAWPGAPGFRLQGAAGMTNSGTTSWPKFNSIARVRRLIPSCAQRGKTSIHKIPPAPL